MDLNFYQRIENELEALGRSGLLKPERVLLSAQGGTVQIDGRDVLNLSANNYLGLANDPRIVEAAIQATRTWGAGLASVRFICGTQLIHKELEREIADYLGFDDAILFAAAFDANGGVFEPLLGEQDAIVSDSLNHASIIDGIRLSKAKRYRYATNDMDDLERSLKKARADGARTILIATDGVFSMDGTIAQLDVIVQLARRHGALTIVDDCHASGFVGVKGQGTASHCGIAGQIDIVTGTFGKALGGAMGGFIAAKSSVVRLLRQRARPYLFSNSLTPGVCGASRAAIAIARSAEGDARRWQIGENANTFRERLAGAGFDLVPGNHAIIPMMLYEAPLAQKMAADLLDAGVMTTGFSFPVVPMGKARIRMQMSAALTTEQVHQAADIVIAVGQKLKVV